MKKNLIIWITAALLVAVAIYVTNNYNGKPRVIVSPPANAPAQTGNDIQPEEQPKPGKTNLMQDYDFELEDLNGNKISLSDYKGKKVYLNFWATWCPPCKAEMPDMEKLYQETKDNGLIMLAVNVGEDKKTVQSFIEDNGYNFPVLLDVTGEVSQLYQVTGIPTSYFIDTEGYLDDGATGSISLEAMKEYVNNLE